MPQGDGELLADVARLRAETAEHKRAMYHHRRQLVAKKEALARLEAECRARGIGFRLVHVPKGENTHGHRYDNH